MTTAATKALLATGLRQDPGPVPLVLAVTGHRDPRPQDLPLLRDRFRELLNELIATLPHTPLVLLNGLAAGMDSEAAEVFLDVVAAQRQQNPDGPSHQLVAALPKPCLQYLEEDFPNEGPEGNTRDRARVEQLLSCCDAVLDGSNDPDLASPPAGNTSPAAAGEAHCYARQGIFLARHAYLLVAFSNGLDSGKVGGTSQTIAMQRGEVYPLFLQVDEVIASREPGVVLEIDTPRLSDPPPTTPTTPAPGTVRYWGENKNGRGVNIDSLPSLEVANLAALLSGTSIPQRIEEINSHLPDFPPADVYGMGVHTGLWRLADHQANRGKADYQRLCRLVMLASALLSIGISKQEWQALGLLVVLAAVMIFPKLQQGPKLSFIQWRCLAESLLISEFWSAAGIHADAADLFHSQTNQNFSWIRTILRARRVQLKAHVSQAGQPPPLEGAVERCRAWIDAQESWLCRTINRQQRWDHRLLAMGTAMFVLSLVLAFAYWLGGSWIDEIWPETCIGVAVAFFGYRELMGYSDTNARYGRSRSQFARAREALHQAAITPMDPPMLAFRQRLVIEAVGREKIDELNDWVGDQLQRVYVPGN